MSVLKLNDREQCPEAPGRDYRIERKAVVVRIVGPTPAPHDNAAEKLNG